MDNQSDMLRDPRSRVSLKSRQGRPLKSEDESVPDMAAFPEEMRDVRKIVEKMRIERLLHGLRQEDLAAKAGVSASSISSIETALTGMNIRLLCRIARGLGFRIRFGIEPDGEGLTLD